MPKGMIFLQVVNAETKALGRAFWSSSVQTPALSALKTELRPGCAGILSRQKYVLLCSWSSKPKKHQQHRFMVSESETIQLEFQPAMVAILQK